MSLEGNLSAFGLSEILQLVGVQQKSGMLSINSRDRSKVLFFKDGMIISTRDRRRKTQDPLKDYLVRYGIVSREELVRLTQLSTQSKLDLTDVMVSEDVFDEDEMVRHHRNQIQEAVHEILTWEQCSYKFIPGEDIIEGLRTWGENQIEGMLMESMRRIDEMPQMLEIFPNPAMLVRKIGALPEDKPASPNEKRMLPLLDRERTLSYLIAHSKMPKYETYETLKHLHDNGVVEGSLTEELLREEAAKTVTRKKTARAPRRNVLPIMVAVVVFAAAVAWSGRNVIVDIKRVTANGFALVSQGEIARSRVESRLRWALESYRAEYGSYPPSLQKLTRDGLTPESLIDNANSLEFRYQLTGNGSSYRLL